MQDRFRIRAWDKQCKKYIEDKDVWVEYCGDFDTVYDLIKDNNPYYVFEQCTGLRDNNGKLIYEGDILLSNDEYFREKYKVEFRQQNSQFLLVGINTTGGAFGIIEPNSLEIIDNIHNYWGI